MDRRDLIRSWDPRRAFKRCDKKDGLLREISSCRLTPWNSIELVVLQDQTVGVFDRERDAGEGKAPSIQGFPNFSASFEYFGRIDPFPSFSADQYKVAYGIYGRKDLWLYFILYLYIV